MNTGNLELEAIARRFWREMQTEFSFKKLDFLHTTYNFGVEYYIMHIIGKP